MSWFVHTLSSGAVDLSLECQDALIAILPTTCAIIVICVVTGGVLRGRLTRASDGADLASLMFLVVLSALSLSSLVFSVLSSRGSFSATTTTTPAATLRFASSLGFLVGFWLGIPSLQHPLGFWALSLVAYGAIRTHSLFRLSVFTSHNGSDVAFASVEIAITVACAVFTVAQTVSLPPFSWRVWPLGSHPLGMSRLEASEDGASSVGLIFFLWLSPIIKLGFRRELKEEDIALMNVTSAATFTAAHAQETLTYPGSGVRPWIVNGHAAWVVTLGILLAALKICQPLVIQALVSFLNSHQDPSIGSWLIVAFSLSYSTSALVEAHTSQQARQLSYRLRAYLIQMILVSVASAGLVSPSPPTSAESSQAAVHVSVDTMNIQASVEILIDCLTSSIVVGVGSYILYRLLGLAFIGPLVLASVCTAVPFMLGGVLQKSQRKVFAATEKRIESTNHFILNARAARLERMEKIGFRSIRAARESEIRRTATYRLFDILILSVASSVTSLCILVSFGLFPVTRGMSQLDYTVLFASLSMISVMIAPLMSTIQMLPVLVQGYVSLRRVLEVIHQKPPPEQERIAARERNTLDDHEKRDYQEEMILHWKSDRNIWNDCDLTLKKGEIVVLSGPSGSGKSLIIHSILRQAWRALGSNAGPSDHRISFCNQTPWFVPQKSIHDNVTFGKDFREDLYNTVMDYCCLTPDVQSLADGHEFVICDSVGANLSGGQRKRIALARALYHEPKLLILDDVSAGLDSKTQADIEEKLFGEDGFLIRRRDTITVIASTQVSPILRRLCTRHLRLSNGHITLQDTPRDNQDKLQVSAKEIISSDDTNITSSPRGSTDREVKSAAMGSGDDDSSDLPSFRVRDEYTSFIRHLGGFVYFTLMVVPIMISIGTEKGSLFWLSDWASRYETEDSPPRSTGYFLGVYAVLVFISSLSLVISVWLYFMRMIPRSGLSIHQEMLDALSSTGISKIKAQGASILNLFAKDVEIADLQLPLSLLNFTHALLSLTASILVLCIPAPYTLLTLLAILPLIFLVKRLYVPVTNRLRTMNIEAQAPMLGTVTSSVSGRDTIVAYGALPWVSQIMHQQVQAGQKPGYIFKSLQAALRMTLGLSNACIAIVLAIVLVKRKGSGTPGGQEVGWAGIALTNTVSMGTNFVLLMTWWVGLEASMGSMQRIMSFTRRMKPPRGAGESASVHKQSHQGRVELRNLTVFRGSIQALSNVSLVIEPGEHVAIIGRTGSGKSTLIDSLFRLVRTSPGQVFMDGNDLSTSKREVEPESACYSRIAGVGQSSFSAGDETVISNLNPSGSKNQREVEDLLTSILSTEDSLMVSSKLHSPWSQCNFSSGLQRQLSLVRMLLEKDGHVYVLDEPTTGLDAETHSRILDAVLSSLQDMTTIWVTHHLHGIDKFDRVFVLEGGGLVESGRPVELLQDRTTSLWQYVHSSGADR